MLVYANSFQRAADSGLRPTRCSQCSTGRFTHLVGVVGIALEPQPLGWGLAGVVLLGLGVLHSQLTNLFNGRFMCRFRRHLGLVQEPAHRGGVVLQAA